MKILISLLILTSIGGCLERPDTLLFKKGQRAEADKQFVEALGLYKKALLETDSEKQREAIHQRIVEVYRAKNQYKEVSQHLQMILLNSQDRKRRIEAKQSLADNEFHKLKNYPEAIKHYSHLIEVGVHEENNRLMIARSYFYLNNLAQAAFEISELLLKATNDDIKFEADTLRANIYFSGKDYKKASSIYEKIMANYPEQAKSNYVLLNLAMSYEEDGALTKALESLRELKSYYHTPDFIAAKIHHIENRMRHLPGGRGRLRR